MITGGTLELATAKSQAPALSGAGGADVQAGRAVFDGASSSAINGLLTTSYNNVGSGVHFNNPASPSQIRSTTATSAIGLGMAVSGGM